MDRELKVGEYYRFKTKKMKKEELIKELIELRDIEKYSQSELMNIGYKTAILDALDLVKKYFETLKQKK